MTPRRGAAPSVHPASPTFPALFMSSQPCGIAATHIRSRRPRRQARTAPIDRYPTSRRYLFFRASDAPSNAFFPHALHGRAPWVRRRSPLPVCLSHTRRFQMRDVHIHSCIVLLGFASEICCNRTPSHLLLLLHMRASAVPHESTPSQAVSQESRVDRCMSFGRAGCELSKYPTAAPTSLRIYWVACYSPTQDMYNGSFVASILL
jgi:hypothetical protein